MEIVHFDDSWHVGHAAAELPRVDSARRTLEQYVYRVPQHAPGASQHEHGDQRAGERVGVAPAGDEHHYRRDQDARGTECIGEYMPECGPHVERVVAGALQDRRSREVDGEARDGDDGDPPREHLRRIRQPAPGGDEDPDRDGDEDDAVHERRQDLGALVTEAPLGSARPSGEPHGDEREREREVVREHVRCVGEKREAAGQHSADELDDREREREREDDREDAPIPGSDGGEVGHGLRICVVVDVRELMKLEVDPAEVQAVYELWKQHSIAEDNRDIGGLLATLTDDCVYRIVGEEERWEGHEGATRFYTGLLTAFPDIDFQLTDIVVGPQGVCEEAHVTATHEGDWLGWPATGERVEFDVVIFFPWDRERRLFGGEKVYVHANGLRG
jgi:predicted ester cyclase